MATLTDVVSDNRIDNLHLVVESVANSQKYLCFTRYSPVDDILYICASDGCDLWRIGLDQQDLDTRRDLAKMNNMDAFLSKLRAGFQTGDVLVTQTGCKLTLNIAKTLDFDLYEATAVDRKLEMQTVLFHLAENLSKTKLELKIAKETVDRLSQQKTGSGTIIGQTDNEQNKEKSKGQTKQVGMSAINPGSKKRKAAKGVVFD